MAKKEQIKHHNEAIEKQLGFSGSVRAGNTIYLSGMISVEPDMTPVAAGDMAGQMQKIYEIIGEILASHGASFADVVNEFMFATDLGALAGATGVRAKFYEGCEPPASTAVEVSALFTPEAMLEVQITAVVD